MRTHPETLSVVGEMLQDVNFLNRLPNGQTDLDRILAAVKNPLNSGTRSALLPLSNHLENIRHLVNNHHGAEGFST